MEQENIFSALIGNIVKKILSNAELTVYPFIENGTYLGTRAEVFTRTDLIRKILLNSAMKLNREISRTVEHEAVLLFPIDLLRLESRTNLAIFNIQSLGMERKFIHDKGFYNAEMINHIRIRLKFNVNKTVEEKTVKVSFTTTDHFRICDLRIEGNKIVDGKIEEMLKIGADLDYKLNEHEMKKHLKDAIKTPTFDDFMRYRVQ